MIKLNLIKITIYLILFLCFFTLPFAFAENLTFECSLTKDNYVYIKWNTDDFESFEKLGLLIGTSEYMNIGNGDYPAIFIDVTKEAKMNYFIDKFSADNVTYNYQLVVYKKNEVKLSKMLKVFKPNVLLPGKLIQPNIFIDKDKLILELRDSSKVLKKYPIAMGYSMRRKLYQDQRSTPEGFYKIINKQPKARFYKAYDINYPNQIDSLRYNFAKSAGLIPEKDGKILPIGGEIQVHGGDINYHWTLGCVAMRNTDINELFSHSEIKIGTDIVIAGWELKREDIESIKNNRTKNKIKLIQQKLKNLGFYKGVLDGNLGINTRIALLKYQLFQKRPFTGELDKRTIDGLK